MRLALTGGMRPSLRAVVPMVLFAFMVGCSGDDGGVVALPQVTIDHVVVDSTGAAIVGGRFSGTIDLGDGPPVTALAQVDGFTAKVTRTGEVTWWHTYGGNRDDQVTGLAVLPDDSVIVTGYVEGVIDLGGGPLGGNSDPNGNPDPGMLFVVRYAADGTHVWSKRWRGVRSSSSAELPVVAADGSIYLVAHFAGGATIDQFSLTFGFEAVLVKLAADGRVRWARTVREPDSNSDPQYGVTSIVARGNDVLVTGWVSSSTDLGTGLLDEPSYVMVRAAAAGALEAVHPYTNAETGGVVMAMASAPDGGIILVGERLVWLAPDLTVVRSIDVTDLATMSDGPYRLAVAANGDVLWSTAYTYATYSAAGVELTREDQRPLSPQFETLSIKGAAVGPDDRFVLAGTFVDTLALGGRRLDLPPGASAAGFVIWLD